MRSAPRRRPPRRARRTSPACFFSLRWSSRSICLASSSVIQPRFNSSSASGRSLVAAHPAQALGELLCVEHLELKCQDPEEEIAVGIHQRADPASSRTTTILGFGIRPRVSFGRANSSLSHALPTRATHHTLSRTAWERTPGSNSCFILPGGRVSGRAERILGRRRSSAGASPSQIPSASGE